MRTILILTAVLLLSFYKSQSQEFLPFASSNYAGITGVHLQPASIADSRYKFDMALSSTSVGFANNFYAIDPYVFWHPQMIKDLDF